MEMLIGVIDKNGNVAYQYSAQYLFCIFENRLIVKVVLQTYRLIISMQFEFPDNADNKY